MRKLERLAITHAARAVRDAVSALSGASGTLDPGLAPVEGHPKDKVVSDLIRFHTERLHAMAEWLEAVADADPELR